MNDEGFMGFVDKLWIFERRVVTIVAIIWVITIVVVAIFASALYIWSRSITNTINETFRATRSSIPRTSFVSTQSPLT